MQFEKRLKNTKICVVSSIVQSLDSLLPLSAILEWARRKKVEGGLRPNGKSWSVAQPVTTPPPLPPPQSFLHRNLQISPHATIHQQLLVKGSAFVRSTSSNANIVQGKTDLGEVNLFTPAHF